MGSGTKLAVALAWVSVMSSLGRRGKRVLGVSSLLIAVARLLLHWNRSGHVSRVRRKQSPTVAIAGTGMAGLCLAVSLKRRGIDSFVMYEKTGDVGGTWNVNTYPGCACDVPVHLYQPSFDLESGWPDRYASQRDLHRNLKRLFLQYDLMRHVVFHTEVKEADFAADKHRWTLQLRSHSEHKTYSAIASVFVSCIGQLSIPKYPAFVDIHHESSSSSSSSSSFTPPYPNHVHSGAWRSDLVLKGKTVAIVGSAASAVQLLGPVAEQAKHVYVFQRSPNWMMPQWKYTYPSFVRALFRVVPGLMRLYRWWQWVLHEAGYLGFLKGNIGHRVVSWALMRYMKTQAKQYTQAKQARKENDKVADKPVLDLLEADAIDLLPTYAMGCKRILMENGWYDNLNRENVVLIKKGVHAVKQHCVCVRVHETKSVQLDVDAVIYCTGYHSTCFLQPMHVLGIDKTETLSQVCMCVCVRVCVCVCVCICECKIKYIFALHHTHRLGSAPSTTPISA
jgi:cation diffusion facilitator CzcD-associated flavoprotein CzcO